MEGEPEPYRVGDIRWVRAGFAYGPESSGPDGCEYLFVSLGPYDKFDPDEFPPPLGRWDRPETWVEGYPQVARRSLLAEDPRRRVDRLVSLAVTPLDAPLGAEVRGADPASFGDPGLAADLLDLVDEHLLLLFRHGDHPPTEAAVSALCRSIGPLRPTLADRSRLPGFPEINRVSNRDADGVQGTGGAGTIAWHSDLSFLPPLIEFLYLDALAVPGEGGDTSWTNLAAAYDALAPEVRTRIDRLGVRYRLRDGLDFAGYFKASASADLFVDTEISLVQTNPRTGRRAVWPNTGPDFAVEVVGLDPAEGTALLADLLAHSTRAEFVYRHAWREGDACLWANTQTMHRREHFPDVDVRVLRHVNILGRADPRQLAATER